MGFFMPKMTKEKLQKLPIKRTIQPQKGPKSPKQSTKNVDLCVKHKVRKEKGKRIILLLQTAMASNLPVLIMVKFFAS